MYISISFHQLCRYVSVRGRFFASSEFTVCDVPEELSTVSHEEIADLRCVPESALIASAPLEVTSILKESSSCLRPNPRGYLVSHARNTIKIVTLFLPNGIVLRNDDGSVLALMTREVANNPPILYVKQCLVWAI